MHENMTFVMAVSDAALQNVGKGQTAVVLPISQPTIQDLSGRKVKVL